MKLFRKKKKRKWVFRYIKKKRKSHALHFTLIDPDKQKPEEKPGKAYPYGMRRT